MNWIQLGKSAPILLEALALAAIFSGISWSLLHGAWQIWQGRTESLFISVRGDIARSILIGLELLVGADILRTLGRAPDFYELGTLAGIILIRSFLSLSLEMELKGNRTRRGTKTTMQTHKNTPLTTQAAQPT